MASKKFLELKEFSDADIKAELEQIEAQYVKMRFEQTTRGLENPLLIREVRRDIARIKTEIRRREVEAMSEEELAGRSKIRARRRR